MEHPVIDSSVQLIEELFSSKVGTPEFSMTVGICALVWVLVTRVLLGMFSSKRGILASGLALVVPLSIGLIAHGMAGLHLVPLVEIDWAAKWLPIAALVLFILHTSCGVGHCEADPPGFCECCGVYLPRSNGCRSRWLFRRADHSGSDLVWRRKGAG